VEKVEISVDSSANEFSNQQGSSKMDGKCWWSFVHTALVSWLGEHFLIVLKIFRAINIFFNKIYLFLEKQFMKKRE
jgi:hypothetical protein